MFIRLRADVRKPVPPVEIRTGFTCGGPFSGWEMFIRLRADVRKPVPPVEIRTGFTCGGPRFRVAGG